MKSRLFIIHYSLLIAFAASDAFAAINAPVVPKGFGDNLTSFSGNMGAINNNQWNNSINGYSGAATGPTANFGNCNAAVMRCATPKCANGGCTDMAVATPIAAGCVQVTETCAQHGDPLVQMIAGQLVANSTAKSNAANAAAAAAAGEQSAEQMAAMQMQMQQMQSQMQQQQAESAARLEQALEQSRAEAAANAAAMQSAAAAQSAAATQSAPMQSADQIASASGVSAEVLMRNQASGEILSKLENVTDALANLKKRMNDVFAYAGCDDFGNNCTGPKRVAKFKEMANGFFTPYEQVLEEAYDALSYAQILGVDLSDIYMFLSDSCNQWGQFMCQAGASLYGNDCACKAGAKPAAGQSGCACEGKNPRCKLLKAYSLNDTDAVYQEWLWPEKQQKEWVKQTVSKPIYAADGITIERYQDVVENVQVENWKTSGHIEVGCASDAIETIGIFKNLKKKSKIDPEVLQMIISQDGTPQTKQGVFNKDATLKNCFTHDGNTRTQVDIDILQQLVGTKSLPRNICLSARNTVAATQLVGMASGTWCEETGGTWEAGQIHVENKCKCPVNSSANLLDDENKIDYKCKCETGRIMVNNQCMNDNEFAVYMANYVELGNASTKDQIQACAETARRARDDGNTDSSVFTDCVKKISGMNEYGN
jgi:hypothetical protein